MENNEILLPPAAAKNLIIEFKERIKWQHEVRTDAQSPDAKELIVASAKAASQLCINKILGEIPEGLGSQFWKQVQECLHEQAKEVLKEELQPK